MPTTACECEKTGWCARHQCWKSDLLHFLCRTHVFLFGLWDQGAGPGQASRPEAPHRDFLGCRHRADVRRLVPCATCRGTVKVKVFVCQVHGECDVSGRLTDTTQCSTCLDCELAREPTESAGGQKDLP